VWWTWLYIDTIYKNFSMPEIPPQRDLRWKYQQLEDQQPWILRQKLYKIDPQEAQKHHPNSTRYIIRALEIFDYTKKKKSELIQQLPVRHPLLMIGLRREKEDTNRRINNRIDHMIAQWLKQEVEQLINQGFHRTTQSLQTIGYKETIDYIDGIITKNERTERIKINTHQFAKRQRTRFKRYIHDANNNPKHNVTYNNFLLSDDQ
jgi:tRNA dimethylallyltransferase